MSAYLVEPHNVAYLAQFFKSENKSDPRSVADIAGILAAANVASVNHRYRGDADSFYDGGASAFVNDCVAMAQSAVWQRFDPSAVVKAANCFEYQACEVSDWEQSPAWFITNEVIRDAARLLSKGCQTWGAPEPA